MSQSVVYNVEIYFRLGNQKDWIQHYKKIKKTPNLTKQNKNSLFT